MQALYREGHSIDAVTVTDCLQSSGTLDSAGGASYLSSLLNDVPTAVNVEEYARIFRDKAIMRSVIKACQESSQLAYSANGNSEEILHKIRSVFQEN